MKKKGVYAPRVPLFTLFEYGRSNPLYNVNYYYMMFAALEDRNNASYYCYQISKKTGEVSIVSLPVMDVVYKVEGFEYTHNIIKAIFGDIGRKDFWVMDKLKHFGRDDRTEKEYF